MDFVGAGLLLGAVCCLLLALQWGGNTLPWRSATIIGLLTGFGIIGILFATLQWILGDKGTISPRILRQRSVLMGCLFEFFHSMTLYIYSYYVPFYFQAVQSVSATTSGIRYIAFAIPEIVAIMISGATVSKIGHYVPFMILCAIVTSVGSGCSTLLSVHTPTVRWALYLVLSGFGIGLGVQLPYTALQVVLSQDDLSVGNAMVSFFQQLGGAIAIPIGNTVLVNGLLQEIPLRTNSVSAQAVIQAGATNLRQLTSDDSTLRAVQGHTQAIVNTLYLALAAACVSLPFAVSMEWKSVRQDTKKRAEDKDELQMVSDIKEGSSGTR